MRKKGFSLIEVLVALLLVSGAAILTSNMWSRNFLYIRGSKIYDTASFLLDQKIAELENTYPDPSQLPEDDAGDFGIDYPQHRWEMKSQPFDMPDLSSLIIEKSQGAGVDESTLLIVNNLKELIKNSVKEVKVTVFVQDKKRQRAFSVVTYFVNKEASLESAIPGL